MVEKPVQQRGGDDGIAEALGETAVGGEDHRALFIAAIDELEEQIATAGVIGRYPISSTTSSAERHR